MFRILKHDRARKNRKDPTMIALEEAIKESQRIADKLEYMKRWRQARNIDGQKSAISMLPEKQENESAE